VTPDLASPSHALFNLHGRRDGDEAHTDHSTRGLIKGAGQAFSIGFEGATSPSRSFARRTAWQFATSVDGNSPAMKVNAKVAERRCSGGSINGLTFMGVDPTPALRSASVHRRSKFETYTGSKIRGSRLERDHDGRLLIITTAGQGRSCEKSDDSGPPHGSCLGDKLMARRWAEGTAHDALLPICGCARVFLDKIPFPATSASINGANLWRCRSLAWKWNKPLSAR